MSREDFFYHVLDVYKKNYKTLGFIPRQRLQHYVNGKYGTFYTVEKSFILVGSLKSKITPIYALYVSREDRNQGATVLFALTSLLPKKKYRVRTVVGHSFWRRIGMEEIRVESNNVRKRSVTVFEGQVGS